MIVASPPLYLILKVHFSLDPAVGELQRIIRIITNQWLSTTAGTYSRWALHNINYLYVIYCFLVHSSDLAWLNVQFVTSLKCSASKLVLVCLTCVFDSLWWSTSELNCLIKSVLNSSRMRSQNSFLYLFCSWLCFSLLLQIDASGLGRCPKYPSMPRFNLRKVSICLSLYYFFNYFFYYWWIP